MFALGMFGHLGECGGCQRDVSTFDKGKKKAVRTVKRWWHKGCYLK
jgi:hypothetical protein